MDDAEKRSAEVAVAGTWTAEGTTLTVNEGAFDTTYDSWLSGKQQEQLWLRSSLLEDQGEFTIVYTLERTP